MTGTINKHWGRLKRSLGRRWKEWRLPGGYVRLGTRYGGWWVDSNIISGKPLLIDCGLGEDISFPAAFLERFGGMVVGVEPNPRSLAYCRAHSPVGMEIVPQAFWSTAGETLTFHMPRSQELLPNGADGVSGSLLDSHDYVINGESLTVQTTDLATLLQTYGHAECDVLKLDIEGAEYPVLDALVSNGDIRRARQLLVEFHHGVTHHGHEDTDSAVAKLDRAGFRLIHVEGRNLIFRREGSV